MILFERRALSVLIETSCRATPKVYTPAPTPASTRTSLGDDSVPSPFLLGNMYMSSCPGKKGTKPVPFRRVISLILLLISSSTWTSSGEEWDLSGP